MKIILDKDYVFTYEYLQAIIKIWKHDENEKKVHLVCELDFETFERMHLFYDILKLSLKSNVKLTNFKEEICQDR